jgi:hypothetical protein
MAFGESSIAIDPLNTILFLALNDYITRYPLVIRTLFLTVLAVAYLTLPLYYTIKTSPE